jgi:hypothetical protein
MNRTKILAMGLLFPVLFSGCASTTVEYPADRVVGRSDNLTSRPDWVSETLSVIDKGEELQVIGLVEVPGDSRAPAAFKASDAAARGHLANRVETQVTKIVESSESGFSMEDQQLQSLIREISRVNFRDLSVKSRYWEKVVRTRTAGAEDVVLKAFSLLTIPKASLKKMVLEAANKSSGTTGSDRAPASIREKLEHTLENGWRTDEMGN